MESPFQNPLNVLDGIQWPVPFTKEDWEKTPGVVRAYIPWLYQRIEALEETNRSMSQRIDELISRTKRNSSNSNQPPSSDSPYKKKTKSERKGNRPGGKKGHKGHRQEMLEPTRTEPLKPESCTCGNTHFPEIQPYYTHQHIELPEIKMEVIHFVLHRGQCPCCGETVKATLPAAFRTGYGPRLSASIAQLAEKTDPELSRFGKWALSDLQRLCHVAEVRPNPGQWRAFHAHPIRLITLNRDRKDAAGQFARCLEKELSCLWIFLEK
ncbi:MAG: DUF6444 domain-containing protein [Pseudomonadota bacterium]